jgi:hypothetical protein
MNGFWILTLTHLGIFVFGVAVSKNLRRWITITFAKHPVRAIEAEIAKLKLLADNLRGRV